MEILKKGTLYNCTRLQANSVDISLEQDVRSSSLARSSAGEHHLDTVGVAGSIPVEPTIHFGFYKLDLRTS